MLATRVRVIERQSEDIYGAHYGFMKTTSSVTAVLHYAYDGDIYAGEVVFCHCNDLPWWHSNDLPPSVRPRLIPDLVEP